MECNKPPFRVSTTNTDQTRRKCNNNNNQPTTHNRLTTNGNYHDCEVQRVQKINMRFFTLLQTSSHCRCSYPMCYICSFSSRCRIVSLNIFWQAENHVIFTSPALPKPFCGNAVTFALHQDWLICEKNCDTVGSNRTLIK